MVNRTRPLVLTWLALMALLALSAGTAWIPLGWMNTAIGLAVAAVKALLVALVFMRLRASHPLLRLTALAGVVTLALLFVLSGTDYATRTEEPAPWQQPSTISPRLGSR
jgi:cytochrome c oxidase subunit 4